MGLVKPNNKDGIDSGPFQVNDRNILQFQEEEEEMRRTKAKKDNQLKIWEKGCNHENKSRMKWIKNLLKDEEEEKREVKNVKSPEKNATQTIMESIEKYLADKSIQEPKESLPEFIAKKKELFLLQMSLNIKRETASYAASPPT